LKIVAVEWYKKSADRGYGVASNNLAGIFQIGEHGQPPDQEAAAHWYKKAREQGFSHTPLLDD
jgi:TPR repeat protein